MSKEDISPYTIASHLWSSHQYSWHLYGHRYNPWMINKIMSMHSDTIALAEQMNRTKTLSHREQYDFYFFSIPKQHRQVTYQPPVVETFVDAVMAKYSVSKDVARQYLALSGVRDEITKEMAVNK